jgi:hypothetical protein
LNPDQTMNATQLLLFLDLTVALRCFSEMGLRLPSGNTSDGVSLRLRSVSFASILESARIHENT